MCSLPLGHGAGVVLGLQIALRVFRMLMHAVGIAGFPMLLSALLNGQMIVFFLHALILRVSRVIPTETQASRTDLTLWTPTAANRLIDAAI
jgi:hypothetical protein